MRRALPRAPGLDGCGFARYILPRTARQIGGDTALFLLDIGNTHTRIAQSRGAAVRILRTIPTAELSPELVPAGERVAAVSVAPYAAARLDRLEVDFITADNCGKLIDFGCVDASTLGADRVANAIAAAEFCALPALVVDCGSAITCELVDEKRRFLGGAIAPGRMLQRAALHAGTAQLPEVDFSSAIPDHPGCNTVEAIKLGVDAGAIGMVRELASRMGRAARLRTVVLAGGDAEFFAPHFPEWHVAEAEFTLQGVRLAAEAISRP